MAETGMFLESLMSVSSLMALPSIVLYGLKIVALIYIIKALNIYIKNNK